MQESVQDYELFRIMSTKNFVMPAFFSTGSWFVECAPTDSLTACRGEHLPIWDVKACKQIARPRIPSTAVSFLPPPSGRLFHASHAGSTVIQWGALEIVQWCPEIRDAAKPAIP